MNNELHALINELSTHIESSRLIHDPLRTLAYGTDASFYRLVPKLVVRINNERELQAVLAACHRRQLPMTFRAAGTSLSGQAITDSVLIQLGLGWQGYTILEKGHAITLQPGIIGARANQLLTPYRRKIGPDPASIDSCMIGGIAANNASGMCCGTAYNTYHTVRDIRVMLADGTVLDTADTESIQNFRRTHAPLVQGLEALGQEARANTVLAEQIRHKYRLKNTTGYSLNSLVDYEDGIDILKHLMVGSEGTLGFISAITYDTVPDEPCKAAALALFPDMATTCRATYALKPTPVSAVELMDRAALRSVESMQGMSTSLRHLPQEAAALLIDVRGDNEAALAVHLDIVEQALFGITTCEPLVFTQDPDLYTMYWKVRKGMFPAVGAVRDKGTTVIIEDVAFPIEHLEAGVAKLTDIFRRHGYDNAILFGHALEGNLHFVFPQGFERPGELARYEALMNDVVALVGDEYGGSLKAEHGTGRNMAPFVEREWGAEGHRLMWELKALFDPAHLLNPDVILTHNSRLHLENLKPLPAAYDLVDKCIECGFCESVCPSRDLTLTPRQRIVIRRELARLENLNNNADADAQQELRTLYQYDGLDTCAADGICQTRCPVGINTGDMVRHMRHEQHPVPSRGAKAIATHFERATAMTRGGLRLLDHVHGALGSHRMDKLAQNTRNASGHRLPQWTPSMPRAASVGLLQHASSSSTPHKRDRVVYLPACATRMFGPAHGQDERSVPEITLSLLDKADYHVIIPEGINGMCCGMAFQSKGEFELADQKAEELNHALLIATENGRWPIICDTSPCVSRLQEHLDARLHLLEPVAFVYHHVLPRLTITPVNEKVAIHVTCSSRRMGLTDTFIALAKKCAKEVVVPPGYECCGFAGDKGFQVPELNASALHGLERYVQGCDHGYSNSRTCEIGLSHHSGVPYYSILALVDKAGQSQQKVSNYTDTQRDKNENTSLTI